VVSVFAIRHGETEWSLSGQHTGTTDIPLTANGCRVAERFQPVLARKAFALVLVSPRQRARQTCELAGLGNAAIVDADLAEWNYGDYEGLRSGDIHAIHPNWDPFRNGFPGGESLDEMGLRAGSRYPESGVGEIVLIESSSLSTFDL
jgi:broad specificity phosphatase PhoE